MKGTAMAKVSIILPIYNVQEYLRECLESVVCQTLQDIEIICVNDGSTDKSLQIIEEYAAVDDRFVIISGPNGGYGKAMNKGLDRATGEYIGIVEPDDYVDLKMYEDLYRVASEHDLDFVKADFYRFTRNESGEESLQYELLDKDKKRYGELLCPAQDPSCIRFTMNTWTGIYRRAFIEKYAIRHNETPGASFQDNGFYFQTFAFAKRAMIVNQPYYRNRRDNPNSSVKSKAKVYCMNIEYDHIRDILMGDRKLWERFKYMYWWKKYHNYWFTYNRIDDSYKREYLERMRQEYKRADQRGELDQSLFTKQEWQTIQSLINHADGYVSVLRSFWIVRKISPYVPDSVKRAMLHFFGLLTKLVKNVKGILLR